MKSMIANMVCGMLVALALAGCIGGDDTVAPAEEGGLPEEADEAKATEDTGSLRGSVGSDLFEPIAGATVTIIESVGTEDPKETKTAKDGTYTINGIEPGRYTVWAAAPGYESKRLPVDIVAGQVSELKFLLPVLPCEECPYEDIREYVGKVSWAASWQLEGPVGCVIIPMPALLDIKNCGGIRGGGSTNGEVPINVTERAHTVFSAMVWQPAGKLGENLQLDLMCAEVPRGNGGAVLDTEHDCYWDTPGRTSPLIHRIDKEDWEEKGYNHTGFWASRVFATYGLLGTYDLTQIDVGVAYEQSFTLYTEVWVNHPAPDDHLPIPDQ